MYNYPVSMDNSQNPNQGQYPYNPWCSNVQPNPSYYNYPVNNSHANPYQSYEMIPLNNAKAQIQSSSFTHCVTNSMSDVLNITKDTSMSDVASIALGVALGCIEYITNKF